MFAFKVWLLPLEIVKYVIENNIRNEYHEKNVSANYSFQVTSLCLSVGKTKNKKSMYRLVIGILL